MKRHRDPHIDKRDLKESRDSKWNKPGGFQNSHPGPGQYEGSEERHLTGPSGDPTTSAPGGQLAGGGGSEEARLSRVTELGYLSLGSLSSELPVWT